MRAERLRECRCSGRHERPARRSYAAAPSPALPAPQAVHMILVRVGDDDGIRIHAANAVDPIRATVDHHAPAAIGDERARVAAMAAAARVDVAAGPEEGQPDGGYCIATG